MKRILFLCTGNYYRSRFAEILFNELASKRNLQYEAFSRGLNVRNNGNVGPISMHTLQGLKDRDIHIGKVSQFPIQVSLKDLKEAYIIIALKKAEHEAYILKDYPQWAEKVQYWHIHDIDYEHPATALIQLENEVQKLIDNV